MFRNLYTKIIVSNSRFGRLQCFSKNPPASAATHDNLLKKSQIEEAVRIMPSLATVSPELWLRTHETFLNHGLQTSSFLRIVTGNPALLIRPTQQTINSLEYWRSCQFGESMMHLLVTKYPELLNVNDGRRLLTQVTFLKGFVSTNKNVWRLLMNCPNLMEQSEPYIEAKIVYLQQEMRIDVPEIVKCEALSLPLSELRCRHVFLLRLGVFIARSLKAEDHESTKNPPLHRITDTSEKTFATKVCHVTLAEFDAFKELYGNELRRQHKDKHNDEVYNDN